MPTAGVMRDITNNFCAKPGSLILSLIASAIYKAVGAPISGSRPPPRERAKPPRASLRWGALRSEKSLGDKASHNPGHVRAVLYTGFPLKILPFCFSGCERLPRNARISAADWSGTYIYKSFDGARVLIVGPLLGFCSYRAGDGLPNCFDGYWQNVVRCVGADCPEHRRTFRIWKYY